MATAKKSSPPKKVVTTAQPRQIGNPEAEAFDQLVDLVREEISNTVSHRTSINDTAPDTIRHYTNLAIKRVLRASRWA